MPHLEAIAGNAHVADRATGINIWISTGAAAEFEALVHAWREECNEIEHLCTQLSGDANFLHRWQLQVSFQH